MATSCAIVLTQNASRYLQQLCKHWGHKFEVRFDAASGHVALPMGTADLVAEAVTLTVTCTVDGGGDLARLQQVVAEHLNRFAFREGELIFNWQPA
jgi:hypothetical protein